MSEEAEVKALSQCVEAFLSVDAEAHERMVEYLKSRFIDDPKIVSFTKAANEFADEARQARIAGVSR